LRPGHHPVAHDEGDQRQDGADHGERYPLPRRRPDDEEPGDQQENSNQADDGGPAARLLGQGHYQFGQPLMIDPPVAGGRERPGLDESAGPAGQKVSAGPQVPPDIAVGAGTKGGEEEGNEPGDQGQVADDAAGAGFILPA